MRPHLMTTVALSVGLLAACQRQADPAATPTAPELAPVVTVAEPASPQEAVQAAKALDQTASQPDALDTYDFDDGGKRIQAVQDPARGLRLADGARTYFYRPGEDAPYLVREDDYAYAYKGGRLTGVVDRDGRPLDERAAEGRRTRAEQALTHGRDLRHNADDKAAPRPGAPASSGRPDRDRPGSSDSRPDAPNTRPPTQDRTDQGQPPAPAVTTPPAKPQPAKTRADDGRLRGGQDATDARPDRLRP